MKKAFIIFFAALLTFSFISCEEDTPKVIEVTSITITSASESQEVITGTIIGLSATILPDDATDKKVTWITSDKTIATVDSTGAVTALKEGTVTITAVASNGLKDEITLSVVNQKSSFTVSFDENKPDGVDAEVNGMPSAIAVTEGAKVQEPPTSPTLDGYEFMGWYTTTDTDTPFNFETAIFEDTTLYAKWIKEGTEITKYTVTFDANKPAEAEADVTGIPSEIKINEGEKIPEPSSDPSLEGYTFEGWYESFDAETAFDFSTPITSDITLYAHWKIEVVEPDPEPGKEPELTEEGSLVEKITEDKFVIESTINSLFGKVQEALSSGGRVPLNGIDIPNMTIEEGYISAVSKPVARSFGSSSKYDLKIEISKAKDKENKQVTLDYESTLTVENDKITGVEPVSTSATVDNVPLEIDSDTFIPVALAFSNTDLLSRLGKVLDMAITQLDKVGVIMEEITLDVPDVGTVIVDCEKSGLTPSGKGVLVFRIVDLDNQWHTMSSLGGQITIDGWANVSNDKIEENDIPLIKDEESKKYDDLEISTEFAPRFYGLYYLILPAGDMETHYVFDDSTLEVLSKYASEFFEEDITVNSYEIEINENILNESCTPEDPGIITVKADMSVYGSVEMVVYAYQLSNDILDSQIMKFTIDGEDYSYLSYDIIKSMFKVFGGFMYANGVVSQIQSSEELLTHESGDYFSYSLKPGKYEWEQFDFSGKVAVTVNDLSITENIKDLEFGFTDVIVTDYAMPEEPIEYKISGSGSSYQNSNSRNVSLDFFSIVGMGEATEAELNSANTFLRLTGDMFGEGDMHSDLLFSMLDTDLGNATITIPDIFQGIFTGYIPEGQLLNFEISNTDICITDDLGSEYLISDDTVIISRQKFSNSIGGGDTSGYAIQFSSSSGNYIVVLSIYDDGSHDIQFYFCDEEGYITNAISIMFDETTGQIPDDPTIDLPVIDIPPIFHGTYYGSIGASSASEFIITNSDIVISGISLTDSLTSGIEYEQSFDASATDDSGRSCSIYSFEENRTSGLNQKFTLTLYEDGSLFFRMFYGSNVLVNTELKNNT